MERSQKLRKLNDLRASVPFLSQSALAGLLQALQKDGLPTLTQTKQIREARESALATMSLYGPLFLETALVTQDGMEMPLLFINFLTYLAGAFSRGGAFTKYMLDLHEKKPSSLAQPWHLLVYCDECHPGNQLSSGSRKAWAIYVSFLEFHAFLGKEDLWFAIMVKRSCHVSKVAAGISQISKKILEAIFCSPMANPQHGILLACKDDRIRLHFTLGGFIQDGAAQRGTWCNRQDSGSRPCGLCKNIFCLKDWASEEDPMSIFTRYIQLKDLDLCTDQEILDSWDRMGKRFGTVCKTVFQDWQQSAGISYSPHALLASSALKEINLVLPVSMYAFDWMHGLCSAGVLNYTFFAVLQSLQEAGMDIWNSLKEFMKFWKMPKALGNCNLQSLFDTKAVAAYKKAACLKCSASEMLSVAKPLQYYVQAICLPQEVCLLQCQCLLAWVDVLDFVSSIYTMLQPSAQKLQALVEKALSSTLTAGFGDVVRPKHHWCLHMASCLERWKCLPSCWAMERKHKVVRKYGNNIMDTTKYERSLLSEVLREHLANLEADEENFAIGAHMISPVATTKNIQKLLVDMGFALAGANPSSSNTCRLACGTICTVGDFVFVKMAQASPFPYTCGLVQCFFEVSGLEMCLLQPYSFIGCKAGTQATKWKQAGTLELVGVTAVLASVWYSLGSNGEMLCLTPAALSSSG